MTNEQWIIFILFTIAINVVLQFFAWKIGYWLAERKSKKEADNDK